MLDISSINIKSLSEEETDLWCIKILEYSIEDESKLNNSYLLNLFRFTRSLLNVKHIQTEVLLEELQNVEQKLEDSLNELDNYKNKTEKENDLRKKLEDQEQTLGNINQQRSELISELQEKNKELIEIKSQSKNDSGLDFGQYNSDKIKNQLKEKNEQIEQLLDKLYDSDRINLELAEQVAKLRVDLTKFENDNHLLNARCQMLEKQNKELEIFNENFINGKLNQVKEMNENDKNNYTNQNENNYFNHLEKELQRMKSLIEVKNLEISELRELNSNVSNNYQIAEKLEDKNDHIERLEEELKILSENFVHQKISSDNEENKLEMDQIKSQKQIRQISKLKKRIKLLKLRNKELNKETQNKDEELIKQRKYISLLIGGDDKIKKLIEENLVFNQMVRSRDNKIKSLIAELNKHQVVSEQYSDTSLSEEDLRVEQEIQLGDQLIALTVDRDILSKQVDAFKTHLESIYHENLELQMGMKEILEGIKQSDTATDMVLECPSLERVCRLLENRSVYFGLNCFDSNGDSSGANITQIILLKSELDHVRGQNEQLRTEMKNLRVDFLAVIDEYTNDILDNWTITSREVFDEINGVPLSKSHNEENEEILVDDDDDDGDNDDEDSLASSEYSIESAIKITEGAKSRPRSRIQRIYTTTKTETKDISTITSQIEMVDVGLNPIQLVSVSDNDNNLKIKSFVSKYTQTTEIEIILAQNEITAKKVETQPKLDKIIADQQMNEKKTNLEILLYNKEVQANPIIYNKSIQTENFELLTKTETESSVKYNSMLNSIRKLINKEREHYRLQENKLMETIEQLNEKLKLVKKEYQIDIDAKNEEIQDLRSKMIKLTSSVKNSLNSNSTTEMYHKRPISRNNSEDFDEDLIKIKQAEMKSKSLESQNIIIFETIVECLQKCLKQKDEALEEYRSMIENIRSNNYLLTSQSPTDTGTFFSMSKNTLNDLENKNNSNTNQPIQIEKVYEELFIKPKIQENNQLIELLRSTLHQLESVRTKSRERVKQLEVELDMKSRQIIELNSKINKLTQQENSSRVRIQSMEAQFKTQDEKIETLKIKLNEMTKKNQQSIQTATALKKKVDNSVFQESADLRSKISELETEVRRLEVEKWNIDKRLNQERQLSKERLTEREQNIEKLSNQILNLQSLLSKMEKKLNKKTQQSEINAKKETKDKCIQTEEVNLLKISKRINDKEKSKLLNKSKDAAKKQEFTANEPILLGQENIHLFNNITNISKEMVQTNDEEKKWHDEDQNEQIDLSRHIIIDAFKREQMSMEMNEISVIGNETLIHMEKKSHVSSTNTKDNCSNKKQQSIVKESTCSSNSTCLECESNFTNHRIEQHLIDLRLERLLG